MIVKNSDNKTVCYVNEQKRTVEIVKKKLQDCNKFCRG